MSGMAIEINKLYFAYEKDVPILKWLDLIFEAGESVGIVGANGVGKSTLLKLLVGLELDYDGSIMIGETPVDKDHLAEVRKHIGYVFQDADNQLFMTTVGEDVAFAPRNYGLPESEVQQRVTEALQQTGIEDLRDKAVYKLSGGEKKLASIATILSMEPEILLMDEPSAALDPRNRRNLIRIINSFDYLKVLTSHDLDFIWDTCKRTVLMNGGEIIADGPTEEILSNKELLEANGLELPLSLQGRG